MPTKNTLGSLLALQVALWIAQRAAAGAVYERFGYVDPVTTLFGFNAGFGVFLALSLALIGSIIGLMLLSSAARMFYLIVNILAIVLGLLHGPIVRSGPVDFCYSANILLTAVILTMIFSAPFKTMYQHRGPEPLPAAMPQAQAPPPPPSAPPPPRITPEPVPQQPVPAARVGAPVCSACGASTQGAKFCPECGKPVATKKVCSRCGVESIPGERFCRECGNPAS